MQKKNQLIKTDPGMKKIMKITNKDLENLLEILKI